MWYLECTVLYKQYRSLAFNIGLFKTKNKKNIKSAKLSFGTYIHSLQSSVFATRKKKLIAEGGENGLLFLFLLKLSQKQNEHASRYSFFKNYISSKTYVLKDQTLYIFLKKDSCVWQKKLNKELFNLYLTDCNGSCMVLLHNARTRALFWFLVFLFFYVESHLSACKEAKTATLMHTPLF